MTKYKVTKNSVEISYDNFLDMFKVRVFNPDYKGNVPFMYCTDVSILDIVINNLKIKNV